MSQLNKFMFDVDFDIPPEPEAPVAEEIAVEEEEVEVAPAFSEEEMDMARDEGFLAGKEAGIREAAELMEQKILAALGKVTESFADVCRMQQDSNREIAREMLGVAATIAKKAFPDLNSRNALGEIDRMVAEILDAILEEPKVQIFVAPALRDPFADRLESIAERVGYEGRLAVAGDKLLEPGDCRVEWANGGAVREMSDLWQQIDEIVERNLKGESEFEVPEDMFAEPEYLDQETGDDEGAEVVDDAAATTDSPVSEVPDIEDPAPATLTTADAAPAEDPIAEPAAEAPEMTDEDAAAAFAPSVVEDEIDTATPETPEISPESDPDTDIDGMDAADGGAPPVPSSTDTDPAPAEMTDLPPGDGGGAGAPPMPTNDGAGGEEAILNEDATLASPADAEDAAGGVPEPGA